MNDLTAPLQAKREELLAAGVLMMDPAAVYVEDQVTVGRAPCCSPGPSSGETPSSARTAASAPRP